GDADLWRHVALVGEPLLEHGVDALDERAAARDHDVLEEHGDGIRGRARDQRAHGLHDPIEEGIARVADRVADLEVAGLAADDDLGVDGFPGRADVGVGFLELTDLVNGQTGIRIGASDFLGEEVVNGVTGEGNADLVLGSGEVTLDEAEVGRAAADVDEERVDDGIDVAGLPEPRIIAETEGGQEGFWNQDHAVEQAGHGLADVLAGGFTRVRRDADYRTNLGLSGRVDERTNVFQKIAGGLAVGDEAVGKRGDEVDVLEGLQRVVAEEDLYVRSEERRVGKAWGCSGAAW